MNLKNRIEEALKHAPEARHSYFQLQHFIIGKETTVQGQMWQCLRELKTRAESMDAIKSEIEDAKDRLELTEINLIRLDKTPFDDILTERELIIKKRRLSRKRTTIQKSIEDMQKRLEYAEQEAKLFLQMFEVLNKEEPVKDFDDKEAQEEYWNEKIGQQINLKTLLQLPIDTELAIAALSLPHNAPIRVQMENSLACVQDKMHQLKQMKENYATKKIE